MKHWLAIAIAVVATATAAVFAGLYFTKDSEPAPVAVQPCEDKVFGQIRSLVLDDGRYKLSFDPALWLSGETANTAAAEDGAVEPGQPVDNDYYILDESDRVLKYIVRPTASVTVLTNGGTAGIQSTPASVAELAEIVETGKSSQRGIYGSLESGFWIRTRIDTICALDHQYRP